MRGQNDLIMITTTYRRYIPQLSTVGPVVVPIQVPINRCITMLAAGIPLYECDPATGRTVALSISNIFDDNVLGEVKPTPTKFNTATPVEVKTTVEEPNPVESDPVDSDVDPAPVSEASEAPRQMTKAERKAAARAKAEAEAAAQKSE